MSNIVSSGFSVFAFFGLTAMLILTRQRSKRGIPLIAASAMSFLWASGVLLDSIVVDLSWTKTGLTDMLRILAWGYFIHSLMLSRAANDVEHQLACESSEQTDFSQYFTFPKQAGFLLVLTIFWLLNMYVGGVGQKFTAIVLPVLWLISTILVLILVERLYTATPTDQRASIQHLCIALLIMLCMDFYVFTDTLIFRRINTDLWDYRGITYGMMVPLIALSVARNPNWDLRLHVSRQAVTGTAVVFVASAYLIATTVAAQLIRVNDLAWAGVAQVAFVLLAVVVLITLLLSKRLRAHLRILVSKHLFNNKYDYRYEWSKFTDTLARDSDNAPMAIIDGLTQIVESDTGAIFSRSTLGNYELLAERGMQHHSGAGSQPFESLHEFLTKTQWLINIDEVRTNPEQYPGLHLANIFLENPEAWLIVPLPFRQKITGIVLIGRSSLMKSFNWEDRDLLKSAGHQAAGILAQLQAHEALSEARQFEAFSKLSAYIVHDLKNILGQQSLIVSNAAKHKHKPEFVDDVIATIDNSVSRMKSLLEQLREKSSEDNNSRVDLPALISKVIEEQSASRPVPQILIEAHNIYIEADGHKLTRVFGHLLQNAKEATDNNGQIEVKISNDDKQAVVTITDNGHGMSDAFIKTRLFQPFESTKGLTGMGIGVYESREYVRELGGDITVESAVDHGSSFFIVLPLS